MHHVWGRGEVRTGLWRVNLKGVDYLEYPGADRRIILRCIFGKWDEGTWTGLIWLRIETAGGLLKRW
jgi:hypothetical protein